jgi:2'-5' RNA ligase
MPDGIKAEVHRLFVALSPPNTVKSEIEKTQNELREGLPDGSVRWTRPEHFHLTLSFLGNVALEQIEGLADRLRLACCDFAPFQLRAERIGFFPERGFPRVIWTAVSNKDRQLAPLQRAIQSATQEFTSEPAEKEFTAHITLGRAKAIRRREAEILAHFREKMSTRCFGEWTANNVELFRSELTSGGAQHTPVSAISLGRAKNGQ